MRTQTQTYTHMYNAQQFVPMACNNNFILLDLRLIPNGDLISFLKSSPNVDVYKYSHRIFLGK